MVGEGFISDIVVMWGSFVCGVIFASEVLSDSGKAFSYRAYRSHFT